MHSPTAPEVLAKRLMDVGWEGLTMSEANLVAEMPAAVGLSLPRPVGIALFEILDTPIPRNFIGMPPRLGKVLFREKLARIVARRGISSLDSPCTR